MSARRSSMGFAGRVGAMRRRVRFGLPRVRMERWGVEAWFGVAGAAEVEIGKAMGARG